MLDEWSGLADLLANLIEKYVADLDIGDWRYARHKIGHGKIKWNYWRKSIDALFDFLDTWYNIYTSL